MAGRIDIGIDSDGIGVSAKLAVSVQVRKDDAEFVHLQLYGREGASPGRVGGSLFGAYSGKFSRLFPAVFVSGSDGRISLR